MQGTAAHTIVIGNEKGGCGKTTTSTHLAVALLRMGFSVGTIDLDARQRTFSRYFENRKQTGLKRDIALLLPRHVIVKRSPFNVEEEAQADERTRFGEAYDTLKSSCDFILIDCPGSDVYLSRLAHSYADTVVTPINDSFIDMDVLATVDGESMQVIRPSIYSEMLWEQKLEKAKRDSGSIDWIVMRNRLSMLDAKNKRQVADALTALAKRIGFRVAPGFSERVIFRELFLQGMTVMDVMDEGSGVQVSMSHIAARQEVRSLVKMLNIDKINEKLTDEKAWDAGMVAARAAKKEAHAATEIRKAGTTPELPERTPLAQAASHAAKARAEAIQQTSPATGAAASTVEPTRKPEAVAAV